MATTTTTAPASTTVTATGGQAKITGGIAACIVNGASAVFYVDDMRNHLRILANRADGDAEIIADSEEGRENYDDRLVRVGGKTVVCKSKDIATASIEKAGVYKSVVVYINEKGILDDIVKSGADAWHQGTLAKSNFKAVPDSPITCVYNTSISAKASKELFKVFYYKADTPLNAPWVAWWNGEKWQSEAVISTN